MTAFKACYSDMKLVKTRQVAQLIFEIPIEEFDAAYEVLGGMPVPSKERWFGIAALKSPAEEARAKPDQDSPPSSPPDRAKRMDWRDVQPAAQAGVRCAEPTFCAFLSEVYGMDTSTKALTEQAVRIICCVNSRTEFGTDHRKRVLWHQLDTEYQAWLAKERVGA